MKNPSSGQALAPAVESSTQPFTFWHARVVLAGILICLGPCALVYNTWSIFAVPVTNSLGASTSQFTFYITLVYLIGAFASPFVGNLIERFDLRAVLTASVLLVALGIGLCSLWSAVELFYLSGVLIGFGIVGLMFLAVPTLVNRWFSKRMGFFVGLCLAMSGVGGALWSMVGGVLLSAADWRCAYLAFSALVLLLGLPATLLLIRSHPAEVGMHPFGASLNQSANAPSALQAHGEGKRFQSDKGDPSVRSRHGELDGLPQRGETDCQSQHGEADEKSVPAQVMFHSSAFYCLMVCMGIFNSLTVVGNLFATYLHHASQTGLGNIAPADAIMLASAVSACIMAFSALSKVGLGALSDKSLMAASVVPCACGALGILCLWFGLPISTAFVYVAGILCGVLYAAVDALGATFTRQIAGPKDYTIIYSRVAIFVNVAGAGAATLFALVAEISWEAEWIMALCLIALAFVLGLTAIVKGRHLERV